MDTDPEAPHEELASAEIDGPSNKVFETRDPRAVPDPPGVTVKIHKNHPSNPHMGGKPRGGYRCEATLDGVPRLVFSVDSNNHSETPEAAKADCREKVGELVKRLCGWTDANSLDLKLNFVEE